MTHPTATATPPPTTVHRRDWPVGSQDVVLCLHGLESHADWFDEFATALNGRRMDVVAYDRTGFGRSPGPSGDAKSIGSMLTELDTVCATLASYKRKHLVGLSWGAALAMRAIAARPGYFSSISLVAPALIYKRRLSLMGLVTAVISFFSGGRVKVALPLVPEDFTVRPQPLAFIRADTFRTQAVTGRFLLHTLALQKHARRLLQKGADLPPTQLLLAGIEPLIDNTVIKRLVNGTKVRVKEWPNCRHSLVFEAPDEIAAAVADLALAGGKA